MTSFKTLAIGLCVAAPAFAHVSLQQASADTGSRYGAVPRVGHDLPAGGASTQGMKTPAVLLQVRSPAAVKVEQAWVRPSVPGQQGTGGYMKLTAREGQRLVGASSPLAGVAEIHEMKMEGEVMKMRAVGALELPAGKLVELKPGGLHLMLMDLKRPLVAGTSVPLTLLLKDGKGVASRVETQLSVGHAPPGGAPVADTHKH